ncbi:hypothetical protein BKM20_26195 [Pseudomonas avellanae]|nr:hypothetical protein BKM20_26195 [Pseudomonas avellanae]
MIAASTSLFSLKFLSSDQIALLVFEQTSTIWTRCQAPSTAGTSLPKGQTPVEPHPHPHAAENKELLTSVVGITQLIAQLQQLDQGTSEWLATRADLSNSGHRLKSSRMTSASSPRKLTTLISLTKSDIVGTSMKCVIAIHLRSVPALEEGRRTLPEKIST